MHVHVQQYLINNICTHVYSTDAYAKSAGYNNIHIVGLATDLHVHRLV